MNSVRLQQLTGVRNDRANQAIRNLEALNILITRRGHYGKWLSINFDLDNWGRLSLESQTNEPYCLLPEGYQPLAPEDEVEFSLYRPPVATTPAV